MATAPLLLLALAAPLATPGAPVERDPTGYSWTVDLGNGGVLTVRAPIPTVESVLPLPIELSSQNADHDVVVSVCESYECLLPKDVVVGVGGGVVHVDALFAGRAPRLKIKSGAYVLRECCDRGLANGRAIAFAGPDERAFAFPSAVEGNVGGVGAFAVDTGTMFAQRPDLLSGFGAVLLDDGWRVPALRESLIRYVRAGGIVSVAAEDAKALDLLVGGAPSAPLSLSTVPYASYGPLLPSGDGVALRLDDRVVRLRFAADVVVKAGGGAWIVREPGRAEDERLAAVPVSNLNFLNVAPQLDPRNVLVVNVAAAGLAPTPMGVPGFSLAVVAIALIGLTLLRSLRHGPVVAARRSLVVGVVGAAALVALRIGFTAGGAVAVSHWQPGADSRRVVNAFARAPNSFGDVDVDGAPFGGKPTVATIVGRSSWRNQMAVDNGRVHAALSSSSGLVGLWFTTDETPGSLERVVGGVRNDFAFPLDYVLIRRESVYGEPDLVVAKHVAAGATVGEGDVERVDHFGSVVEERLARDIIGGCGGECAVGIFTRNGVVTAVESQR